MKKLLTLILCCLPFLAIAADDVVIDKNTCTITKDGKTFPLHGKVKIVDSFPDLKVKIVDAFPNLEVKIVDSFPDECGKVKIVKDFPDVKVQIVDAFPDITIKIVDAFPGVKNEKKK